MEMERCRYSRDSSGIDGGAHDIPLKRERNPQNERIRSESPTRLRERSDPTIEALGVKIRTPCFPPTRQFVMDGSKTTDITIPEDS